MFSTLLTLEVQTCSVETSRYRCHGIPLFTPVVPASPHSLRRKSSYLLLKLVVKNSHDHRGCKGISVMVVMGVKAVYFYNKV